MVDYLPVIHVLQADARHPGAAGSGIERSVYDVRNHFDLQCQQSTPTEVNDEKSA
jgi:hypothetical protein